MKKDPDELKIQLERFLRQTVSSFDSGYEGFYHGWLLGIIAIMNNLYRVTSNRESGDGRYDIQLMPLKAGMPGFIIEIKVLRSPKTNSDISDRLKSAAGEALNQIDARNYDSDMRSQGVEKIVKIGMAFCKKQVEILSKE